MTKKTLTELSGSAHGKKASGTDPENFVRACGSKNLFCCFSHHILQRGEGPYQYSKRATIGRQKNAGGPVMA